MTCGKCSAIPTMINAMNSLKESLLKCPHLAKSMDILQSGLACFSLYMPQNINWGVLPPIRAFTQRMINTPCFLPMSLFVGLTPTLNLPRGNGSRSCPTWRVEIKSPSNTMAELHRKAAIYLRHGAQLVWIVMPDTQSVEVCRLGGGWRHAKRSHLQARQPLRRRRPARLCIALGKALRLNRNKAR